MSVQGVICRLLAEPFQLLFKGLGLTADVTVLVHDMDVWITRCGFALKLQEKHTISCG